MKNARRRRMSVPTIHGGGGKFRHGLLQLLIHSIDPLHEHEGKVDEKASQLHTIASLGVLLDATGPGTSGSPTPTPLNGSAGGAGARTGSSAHKDSSRRANLDNNVDFQVGPGAGEEKSMPPVEESLETSSSLNEATHPDSGYNSAAQQAAQAQTREDTIEEAMEEAAKPLSVAWPDTWRERLNYIALAPIIFPLWLTLPDVRREEKRKYVAGSFLENGVCKDIWVNRYRINLLPRTTSSGTLCIAMALFTSLVASVKKCYYTPSDHAEKAPMVMPSCFTDVRQTKCM
ncbi:sodium/potassium/calcium exchanger Nckx30C isoform X1 [Tropilaelaps mercedesae]|uniref:Sodium/potassium/calcium exchanger Nckx30C isoform X1 n=1 Tax=Tropilaelaps mercedesae TaxID=418985 RepID=A0A1V9XVD1_9ACAR|nr:sodium/potassium/calcium exchanger Nckx30C isoform X1 [Tropilaelaps mercedesae]